YFERPAGDAKLVQQRGQHLQNLSVAQWTFASSVGRPNNLGANLRKLAVASLLRTLAAKLRADVIELLQLARLTELVLDVGAYHPGGIFRPQGEGLRGFEHRNSTL